MYHYDQFLYWCWGGGVKPTDLFVAILFHIDFLCSTYFAAVTLMVKKIGAKNYKVNGKGWGWGLCIIVILMS